MCAMQLPGILSAFNSLHKWQQSPSPPPPPHTRLQPGHPTHLIGWHQAVPPHTHTLQLWPGHPRRRHQRHGSQGRPALRAAGRPAHLAPARGGGGGRRRGEEGGRSWDVQGASAWCRVVLGSGAAPLAALLFYGSLRHEAGQARKRKTWPAPKGDQQPLARRIPPPQEGWLIIHPRR